MKKEKFIAKFADGYQFEMESVLAEFTIAEIVGNTLIVNDKIETLNDALYGCTGLISVTIPDSVTSIGNHAFYNCERLENVCLGKTIYTSRSELEAALTKLGVFIHPDAFDDTALSE